MTQHDNLPPLPKGKAVHSLTTAHAGERRETLFTADQMREYAREAIAESEAESLPAAWIAGKKAGLLEALKPVHRGVDAGDSGGLPMNYVYEVPDHCDRILWRGQYLGIPHLPNADIPVSPWLPIDSAPKVIEFHCVVAHQWSAVTAYWDGSGWVNERSRDRSYFQATHWMPIPPLPEEKP